MPKVEAPVALIHNGAEMVLRVYLDRANAEIERVTRQRDEVARSLAAALGGVSEIILRVHYGLNIAADGTVTEIGHG